MRRMSSSCCHRHAGIAADEMQHPVMGPAKAELLQDRVGIGHEIPVGEEQQLDQRRGFRSSPNSCSRNYVSHLTYFSIFVTL